MLHVEQTNNSLSTNQCPLCGKDTLEPFLTCKDFTVSKEYFHIVFCSTCKLKFTNPRPDNLSIGNYYKSEEYVSHSNTKKGLINKLYHLVRSYTLKNKLKLISRYVSRGTILDYGCGTGMFLKTCKDAGWNTFGFEPDKEACAFAREKGLNVFENKETIKQSTYDIISLWHVLEHVNDLNETLSFFKNYLSDKGRLIIAVPNHVSFDAKFYKEFWAGYDVPRHLYHFESSTITALINKFGFTLEEMKPMKFDSYYVSLLSEKYKTGSMNYFSAFLNGLKSNNKARKADEYSSVIYIFKKA